MILRKMKKKVGEVANFFGLGGGVYKIVEYGFFGVSTFSSKLKLVTSKLKKIFFHEKI